jgi:uncharacterized protein YecE (DUF72 family)
MIFNKGSKIEIEMNKSTVQIGCQGWNYADWVTKAGGQNIFYPRGTKAGEMLEFYSQVFDTIEVDSTFYAIPPTSTLESWYQKTPEQFTFSLKLPQEISHTDSLAEKSYETLEVFCERIESLQEKLAVVLIQLAPQFEASKTNAQNLRKFLARLSKNIKFAVEFRNRQWMVEWTFQELRKNSVALCLVEGNWIPREMMFEAMKNPTTDFTYTRFMGERDLTNFSQVVRPQDANLEIWQTEFAKLQTKHNFIYFSNFYEGFAPESANKLKQLFGQEIIETSLLETQKSLF